MQFSVLAAAPRRLLALLTVVAACSTDGGTDPTGDFTIAVSPTAVSGVQGGTGQTTVTLTRTDGFSGAVTFAVEGAPTGVTGAVAGAGTTAVSTGTVTITVGAAVATGVYNLTLRASAAGLDAKTTPLTLTVTASGGFSIAPASPTLTLAQGGSGSMAVTLTRTGTFAGATALTVTGAPTGVTATVNPATIAAGSTTASLDLVVGAAVVVGTYPLVITGVAAGLPNATATLTLTVTQPVGSFTLTATAAALSVPQGTTGQTIISVTRSSGFTGAVTLALTGTAQGITAGFQPVVITAGSTTSVVTFTVPVAAVAGAYPLVITGTGAGVANATVTVTGTVVVAPTGSFTAEFAPSSATVQAGSNATAALTVTRTAPFNGGVGFTVAGLPANATMTFAPTALTNAQTTTTATIATTGAVEAGVYPLVVTGLGTGVAVPPTATATYTLTVTAAPAGNNIGFQFCDLATAPLWFAVQDVAGVGSWNPVAVGANTTYRFDLASNSGGVAWVEPDGSGGFHTQVILSSKANIEALAATNCTETSSTKTVTGSVLGLTATDIAFIGLGTAGSVATFGLPSFTINNVPSGSRSLIAARNALNIGTGAYTADKVVIRRGQNIAGGGTIPVINFDAEGTVPVAQNLTLLNLTGWVASSSVQYFTDNGGSTGTLVAGGSPAAFPSIAGGVAGDFHFLTAVANPSLLDASQFRSAGKFFFAPADQTVTLGPVLATPTVINAGAAGYARLQATGAVQADYGRLLSISYAQTGRSASIMVTGAPFVIGGDATYSLAFPIFSGLAGWLDTWMPANGVQTNWTLFAQGWTGAGILNRQVIEGEVVLTAGRGGIFTP